MYAVIVSGGKQHRVKEGETLKLEKIEVETGATVEFDQVLLVSNGDDVKVGTPVVAGAKVTAEVVSHGRHKKIKRSEERRVGKESRSRWTTHHVIEQQSDPKNKCLP